MKIKILIPNKLKKKINRNTIWITGTGRSGTTIIGKILASFKNTQYFYEPDFLPSLLYLNNKINKNYFNHLFENYFYIDLIKNGLNNRRINLNRKDDSYFFNSKNKSDLEIKNNFDIFNYKKGKLPKVIIKLPDFVEQIFKLKKFFNFKIIYVDRDPLEVINSMIKKKWWSKNLNRTFPVIEFKKEFYPWWLNRSQYKEWKNLNEYERCALYILRIKKSLKNNQKIKIINYADLISDPNKFVKNLSIITRLSPSSKTFSLIKKIKKRNKTNFEFIKKRINKKTFKKLYSL